MVAIATVQGDELCPVYLLISAGPVARFLLSGLAQPLNSGVDRLYVLECGHGTAPDQGRFSPGYNDGKPLDFADNCYLIHHTQGYLLWGTGIADKFFEHPAASRASAADPTGSAATPWRSSSRNLASRPSDIRYIGLTNSHIDHIGNLEMFPSATILMQRSEWDFAETHRYEGTPDEARFNAAHPVSEDRRRP